jgi:uncharacterized protein Usg
MKHLGWGMSSEVFQSKHDRSVIKIFKPDKGYTSFLKLISENKDNPHFPKIRKLVSFKHKDNKGLHLIKLEKLHLISSKEWVESGIVDYLLHLRNINNREMKDKYKEAAEKFKIDHPRLADALDKVTGNRNYLFLDINRNNVMKRDNGQFVITDPYSSQK